MCVRQSGVCVCVSYLDFPCVVGDDEVGRGSCVGRVEMSVGAGSLNKKRVGGEDRIGGGGRGGESVREVGGVAINKRPIR